MNEKMPTGPNPEEQEENERYEQWMADHPVVETPEEERVECEPHIHEYEKLITSFEAKHSLEELHAIVELTIDDAPNHLVWYSAKQDLIPIIDKFNFLKQNTNISPEKLAEMKAKRKRVSNAVGIISKGRVNHDR